MKKLLVICGPTATGKTKLAIHLAKRFKGELVSADSRQVYKEMDIGTGKGLPLNAKYQTLNAKLGKDNCYYDIEGVKVWGYDLIEPTERFSVAQYTKITQQTIRDVWWRKNLPILVGGTGLYIKAIVNGIPTVVIPPNKNLRKNLEGKDINGLFEYLAQLDPTKAASLNISDRKNPRRLVRAIEIASWKLEVEGSPLMDQSTIFDFQFSLLMIGLTAAKDFLKRRIKKRSQEMLNAGLIDEIRGLLAAGVRWNHQAMNAIGYKEWRPYFEGEKEDISELVKIWVRNQVTYAKEQMTWFRRDKKIHWFNITDANFQKDVEKLVEKWYSAERRH